MGRKLMSLIVEKFHNIEFFLDKTLEILILAGIVIESFDNHFMQFTETVNRLHESTTGCNA